MKLTEAAIKKFELIWKTNNPGKEISSQELIELATNIMRSVKNVYRPIPKEKADLYKKLK